MERIVVGRVKQEECDNLSLILTKISCAKQALKYLPEELPPEEKDFYIKSCIDALGNYAYLEKNWWQEVLIKYNLKGNIYINFNTGDLYTNE